MTQTLLLILAIAFVAVLVVATAIIWRRATHGKQLTPLFASKQARRRLGVIEQISVDARRTLLLIRRDDVEHLVMTGGPVDVIIESNIGAPRALGTGTREIPTQPPLNGHTASDR